MISSEPAPMLEDKEKWYITSYNFNNIISSNHILYHNLNNQWALSVCFYNVGHFYSMIL